jgi:hypothetical protein
METAPYLDAGNDQADDDHGDNIDEKKNKLIVLDALYACLSVDYIRTGLWAAVFPRRLHLSLKIPDNIGSVPIPLRNLHGTPIVKQQSETWRGVSHVVVFEQGRFRH